MEDLGERARFGGVVLAVRDLVASRRFYEEVLDQRLRFDFGENIAFESGLALHLGAHFARFVGIEPDLVATPFSAGELYFEIADVEGVAGKLAGWPEARIVQPCFTQAFGQRVLRFRDPDGHLIEVGEPMAAVALRFWREGLSMEEISGRTQLPIEAVRQAIARGTP